MTSTVVITAHPASPMNVVRVVQSRKTFDNWAATETVIQYGASATFHVTGNGDSILIEEEFVVVIPSPEKDTP